MGPPLKAGLNIQTRLRISEISEIEDVSSVEAFFPERINEFVTGKDADTILDRAEELAATGGSYSFSSRTSPKAPP